MKESTVIASLFRWFQDCELLSEETPLNVDRLEEEAGSYCLETVPCTPVIRQYMNGSAKKQYLFIFASRDHYSADEVNNLKNLEFFEDLQEWMAEQNINDRLPVLPDGCTAQGVEVLSGGYVQDNDTQTARYQIQCRLTYIKEANLIDGNSIPGVGVIDKNLCYKDYPTIIKDSGKNGWSGSGKTPDNQKVSGGITAAQAMSAARGLVGKDEDPDECDIMKWYGGFDTDINEIACCCAGMMYLFFKILNAGNLIPGGKVADCGSIALNFYNAGQLHTPSEVKPGDIVVFSWSHSKTSVSPLNSLGYMCFEHVELCLKVLDDTILSIGANNGGIECDDFQIKTRKRSDISACCRPAYADGGEEDTAATVTEAVYGDRDIYEVQQWLNSHFGFDIYIDGVYGPQTRAALVMALQTVLNRDYGADLEVDGIYGRLTRKAVVNLERGAYGDYVKVLQGFLICMGYDTGGFDGDFGGRTEESVKTFQTVRDLYVDGIAGKNTFEKLAE